MGLADLFRSRLRLAPCAYLAFLDELTHPVRYFLNIAVQGNPVLIIEIDVICLQSFQACFKGVPHALLGELFPSLAGEVNGHEFGDQNDLVAKRLHRFAHQFLVYVWAVGFGCIKEIAAKIVGQMHQTYGFLFFRRGAIAVRKAHTAHSNRRNFKISQFPVFHSFPPDMV